MVVRPVYRSVLGADYSKFRPFQVLNLSYLFFAFNFTKLRSFQMFCLLSNGYNHEYHNHFNLN